MKPNMSRPIGDQSMIGMDNTSATRKRLRMSRTMASIDIPACPPWPITSCGGPLGVSHHGRAVHAQPPCHVLCRPIGRFRHGIAYVIRD